ncbi:MAG: glyoxalase [Gammaproteobacteria bacterium]|nr:glyoxalase [Gammaproteobacteria bacterium]
MTDLHVAKHFYIELLGATIGRENGKWLDILLWGHQITLHNCPNEVLSPEQQGTRHFGIVLPWDEWENNIERIRAAGHSFLLEPKILKQGTPQEQAKFYLQDPSNNVIEIKAYRDFNKTLKQKDNAYSYALA